MQLLPVRGGKHFKEMYVGKSLPTYDSMIVLTHFKGHAAGGFGGSLKNIAIGCAGARAAEPTIGDIGMVASTDLLAIDQASVDLVYNKPGDDNKDLIERIESREGLRQLSYMRELKMGNPNYELISID